MYQPINWIIWQSVGKKEREDWRDLVSKRFTQHKVDLAAFFLS